MCRNSEEPDAISGKNQRQQTAGTEAADLLRVTDLAGLQRMVSEAVPVFEKQNTVGVESIEAIVGRVDALCSLSIGELKVIPKELGRVDPMHLPGQGEQ